MWIPELQFLFVRRRNTIYRCFSNLVAISDPAIKKQALSLQRSPLSPAAHGPNFVRMVGPIRIFPNRFRHSWPVQYSGTSVVASEADEEAHILRSNCICDGIIAARLDQTVWCVGCNLSQHMVCMSLSDSILHEVYYCHMCQPTMPIHQATVAALANGHHLGTNIAKHRHIALGILNIAMSPDMICEWRRRGSGAGSPVRSDKEVQECVAAGIAIVFDHMSLRILAALHRRLWEAGNSIITVADKIVEQAAVMLQHAGVSETDAMCLRNAFKPTPSP